MYKDKYPLTCDLLFNDFGVRSSDTVADSIDRVNALRASLGLCEATSKDTILSTLDEIEAKLKES